MAKIISKERNGSNQLFGPISKTLRFRIPL